MNNGKRKKCKYWVEPTIANCKLIYMFWTPEKEICYCAKRKGVGNCNICKEYEEGNEES